ncbi:hypothetical protein [Streptomyces sp. NPDC021224]|uniref:hypothetical protein n=1 Tax=unclassified Streptomyces TaxID=2593676 RepID=UPI00378D3121
MTITETAATHYDRLDVEFAALRHVDPKDRTAEQEERLRVLHGELVEILSRPPAGYELPRIATDLMAHAKAHGWQASLRWTPPGYSGEPFMTVEVGRKLAGLERNQHRGDRWHYQLTWHSRDCVPGKVKLFRAGLASTPDNPADHDAPSIKAIRAIIEANPGPDVHPADAPIVAGDLYRQVLAAAKGQCQCQGACGKKHADAARKPGRCENGDGTYTKGVGSTHILAIPRDPTLPFHEAAALPARRLIAFCRPCADGVRRVVNRAVKALPPQDAGLFDVEPYRASEGGDVT